MYTYSRLLADVERLSSLGAETGSIGRSLLGGPIPYVMTGGDPAKTIVVTGAIHARENVTAALVMAEAEHVLRRGPGEVRFAFVPMVNPDGAVLIETGGRVPGGEEAVRINGGSHDFSLWKANARGVDLNVNFDARFGRGRQNVFSPAPESYVGPHPFSEPETQALRDFTLAVRPAMTVSYHALGRVVYWYFHQTGRQKSQALELARAAAELLSYRTGAGRTSSAGGYKDWCVSALGIPALTIEVVSEALSHPLGDDALPPCEIEANLRLPFLLAEKLWPTCGTACPKLS